MAKTTIHNAVDSYCIQKRYRGRFAILRTRPLSEAQASSMVSKLKLRKSRFPVVYRYEPIHKTKGIRPHRDLITTP